MTLSNTKFIKLLIIVNGVLLFFVLVFAMYTITKELFPKKQPVEKGIVVGEALEKAKKDSVALQGLKYDNPIPIYNSKNSYLPISLLTYKEEKRINKMAAMANDYNGALLKFVNVIFLDENYQVINSLVDKKASIAEIKPQRKSTDYTSKEIDKTVKYIGYLVAFKDTNVDGKLNSLDHHDLYISNLDGQNFTRVSTNIAIDSFEFIKSNSQIFIKYTHRENRREEHKKQKFAIYDIAAAKFLNLLSLDSELDKLEQLIIQ